MPEFPDEQEQPKGAHPDDMFTRDETIRDRVAASLTLPPDVQSLCRQAHAASASTPLQELRALQIALALALHSCEPQHAGLLDDNARIVESSIAMAEAIQSDPLK